MAGCRKNFSIKALFELQSSGFYRLANDRFDAR